MTTALEWGEGSASRPSCSLPPGKTRYPLYRRLGEPQGRSGQVRKISPPPGFDPRTVQPVVSRYTDYATRPTEQDQLAYKLEIEVRKLLQFMVVTDQLVSNSGHVSDELSNYECCNVTHR